MSDCPPIYWKTWSYPGALPYASFSPSGVDSFAVIGECVGDRAGTYSVRIVRKDGSDLHGYAGSVEQAKRHVERWARSHWRTV